MPGAIALSPKEAIWLSLALLIFTTFPIVLYTRCTVMVLALDGKIAGRFIVKAKAAELDWTLVTCL